MDESKNAGALYNRKIGVIVLVLAVLLSVFIGGGRGLRSARSEVIALYTNGVEGDGVGIAKDLSVRFTAAEKLLALAQKNGADVPELSLALAAYQGSANLSELAEANGSLDTAAYTAYNLLQGGTVSEADRKSAQSLYNEINSRGNMIKNDGYNAAAAEFNEKTLGSFPASLLAGVCGVEKLELFR